MRQIINIQFVAALQTRGSFEQWHIKTYLSTLAVDGAYVAGAVSASQRTKVLHRRVDEALAVLEKLSYEVRE